MEEDQNTQDYLLHEEGGAKSPPRRRRPPLSCTVCRRRKLKCDRSLPCGQCVKSKTPDLCVYTGPHGSQMSEFRHAGSEAPGTALSSADRGSPVYSGLYVFDSKHHHSSNRITKPRGRLDELHELRSRIQSLENALVRTGSMPTPESMGYDALSDLGIRVAPDAQFISDVVRNLPERACFRGKNGRTRFCGRSTSGVALSFIKDIQAFMKGCRSSIKSKNSEYKKMKKFKGELWSREKQELQRVYRDKAFSLEKMLPTRKLADELLKLYLSTFETTYRILHVPTFLRQYEAYWARTDPVDIVFVAKLLALMAASSCFLSPTTMVNGTDSLRNVAVEWILTVQSWTASSFVSASIGLDLLQVECLLMIARQADAVGGDLVWINSGSLIRTAMTMGLHRDPRNFSKMSKFWAEMRRRMWATILELDLQASVDGGMAPSIDLDQYDCDPPMNCDDSELTEDMTEDPTPRSHETLTRTSFLAILSRSLPLRVRIAKVVNSLKFSLSYDEALRLSEELVHLLNQSLGPFSDGDATVFESDDLSFARSFMAFLMQRSLLTLHRPFSLSIASSPKFSYSRKLCLESSLEMLSQLEVPVASLPGSHSRPYLGHMGGGMFQDECFHAALMICVELSLQADEFSDSKPALPGSVGSLNALVRSQQDVLVQAVERTMDKLGGKITGKGKGCKPVFFLSMALASVKARLRGEDSLGKIEEESAKIIRITEQVMRGVSWADAQRQFKSGSLPPLLTPDLSSATPELPFDPTGLLSTDPIDFSSLGFGNIFDFGDDEMPELWDPNFLNNRAF